ncbi:MAG: DNA topology modulation protein [Paenisporosarcina sp.]
MKQIMVIGISAGVGKSTFARRLGEALDIDVFHLDTFYWKPNWVEAPEEEFSKAQQEIVKKNQWIIEGNYYSTFEMRAEHADTIIYLELPLYVCLYRVIKRRIMNNGKTRPDMGEDCKEKIDWAFIKFIITTYYPRKREMEERFQVFQTLGAKKDIIQLKSKREIHSFLENIHRQACETVK